MRTTKQDQYSNLITWITGAGTGIGRALAIEIAKRGGTVALSGRREEKLQEVKKIIIENGGRAEVWVCDVTNKEMLEKTTAAIAEKFGRLDICVANAGFSVYGLFHKILPEEWRQQMEINFFGVIWTLQAALPYLKKSRGRIVVISSVAGKLGAAKISAYCSSKFALVGLCDSIYQELKPAGISVTCILPGFVESDIIRVGNDGTHQEIVEDKRPKKLIWPAEKAAKPIAEAIFKRKRAEVITGHGKFAVFLARFFPGIIYWLMTKQTKEPY